MVRGSITFFTLIFKSVFIDFISKLATLLATLVLVLIKLINDETNF